MTLAAYLPRTVLALCALAFVYCSPTVDVTQSNEALQTEGRLDGKVRIRMMAANITSGNQQSYDSGEGIRIFQAVKPDVAMLQEFNYGSDVEADFRSMVQNTFGSDFVYFRGDDRHIPNGIVSRYPIKDAGEWADSVVPDRQLTWARIDIPGDKDLWAISVHFSTSNAANRNTEAKTLLEGMRSKGIPDADYVVLGGDFNTKLRSEPCIQTLASYFVTSGPYPVDRQGNDKTNAARAKPYDWVLSDPDLHQYEIPVVLGSSTFTKGLVVDTRVYSPLEDIAPAKASDSGSTNMQHMAIVRDFAVPSQPGQTDDTPPPPPPPPPPSSPTGEADLAITEVLANEPGSDTDGEMIALTNHGGERADMSGWTLADNQRVRHVFADGTHLEPGMTMRIYGRDATTGTLALSNSGDNVILRDATGNEVDSMSYSAAGADGASLILGTDGSWSFKP